MRTRPWSILFSLVLILFGSVMFRPACSRADDFTKGLVVGRGLGQITISGGGLSGVEVNQVLTITGVPNGAVCQMYRNTTAISGATSCTTYTVQAADVAGGPLILQVRESGISAFNQLTVSGSPTLSGQVGTAYAGFTPVLSGGPGIYTCSLTGTIPGLSLTGCTLGGTPTQQGNFTVSFNVTDAAGGSAGLPGNPLTFVIAAAGGGPTGSTGFFFPAGKNLITAAAVLW